MYINNKLFDYNVPINKTGIHIVIITNKQNHKKNQHYFSCILPDPGHMKKDTQHKHKKTFFTFAT